MRTTKFIVALLPLVLCLCFVRAQSSAPITVQAATSAPAAAAPIVSTAAVSNSAIEPGLKILEEMKVQNEDTLKKQEAALQQLDELQQAAEQLRIYAKRG